ncbi:MAG TPA: hypothetical protein VMR25_23945 [Planctomycetaceae bacterium]|nr:hypothetical protein [Planctomycetaceae bacterium]
MAVANRDHPSRSPPPWYNHGMNGERKPSFAKRLMWAAVPFVLVGAIALRFDWPPLCGLQAMLAVPILVVLLIFAAYWALWALL